jgi:hypothetical protein
MVRMISRDFKKYPQVKLSGFSSSIAQRMSDDARFSNFTLMIDELKVLNLALSTAASNAVNRDKEKIAIKSKCMNAVCEKLDVIAVNIELMANGDEVLVMASGFELYKKPTALTQLLAPTGLVVVNDPEVGAIKANWKEQAGAVNYGILYQLDGETEWRNGTYTTSREIVLSGFKSGSIIWVKVYAMGTREIKSTTCEPVSVMVI